MKKLILSLLAMMTLATGANAQVIQVYKTTGGVRTQVATYTNSDADKYQAVLRKTANATVTKVTIKDASGNTVSSTDLAKGCSKDGFTVEVEPSGASTEMTYSVSPTGGGVTVDPSTGKITATSSASGTYTITATPVEGTGSGVTASYTVNVTTPITNLEIGTTCTAGSAATLTVTPSSGTTSSFTWSIAASSGQTLPSDVSIDPETGVISAVTPGTYVVTATANDGSNMTVTTSVNVKAIEYVTIGSLKWATMNLGATTVANDAATSYGDYYAWGEIEPYATVTHPAYNSTGTSCTYAWQTTTTGYKPGAKTGYSWTNYDGNSSFQEWSPAPYDATTKVLTSGYDVVNKTLGGNWRMPTSTNFANLFSACGGSGTSWSGTISNTTAVNKGKGVYFLSVCGCTVNGVKYNVPGALFIASGTDKTQCVFFPAAGFLYGTSLNSAGTYGFYWSSSLYISDTSDAYSLYFYSSSVNPQNSSSRCGGFAVRPVSE